MARHQHFRRYPTPAQLLNILLLLVACGLVPLLYINLLVSALDDLDNKGWGNADFTPYYTAARLIRNATSPYDERAFAAEMERLGFRNDRPYIYFPLLAIIFTPLTLLSPREAATTWFCVNLAILIGSTILMIGTLQIWKRQRTAAVGLVLASLTFYPSIFSVYVGQANSLLLLLLVLAWYLARRGSDALAGTMIAAASLVKIFPFCVALYFLWKGRYRLFLFTLGALVVLLGLTIAAVGLDAHLTYVNSVLPTQFVKTHPLNQSLSAFFARALPTRQVGSVPMWQVLSTCASGLLVLGTVVLIPAGSRGKQLFDLEFSLVVVGMLLVSTVSWMGTMTLLILPYAVVTAALLRFHGKSVLWPSIVALASFLAVTSYRATETYALAGSVAGPVPPWLLGMPMYGMIVLWLSIGYFIMLGRRQPPLSATGRP
jgi:hypothetical protein